MTNTALTTRLEKILARQATQEDRELATTLRWAKEHIKATEALLRELSEGLHDRPVVVPSMADQLRDEHASGLDSVDPGEQEEH